MTEAKDNTILEWDLEEQDKRVLFMEHLYKCDRRDDPSHPLHGVYTNLWRNFCLNEAGKTMRDEWFQKMEAIHRDLQELSSKQVFIPTFDD